MLKNRNDLCCPCCKSTLVLNRKGIFCSKLTCLHSQSTSGFNIINDVPILVSTVGSDTLINQNDIKSLVSRKNTLSQKLKSIFSRNKLTESNFTQFIRNINSSNKTNPKILVIGSGEKGNSSQTLWQNKNLVLTGVDVYISPTVNFVVDAHYLPFADNSFDGVVIQAVLEHVVEPIEVVAEIHRVLKAEGVVYSETPFIQFVHEGAYDFTRFTVLGHRYLFKKFSLIAFGPLNGIESSLAWAIRQFLYSIFGYRRFISVISASLFIILKPLALLESKNSRFDSCSGSYFLGKKSTHQISHSDIIDHYKR